MTNWSFQPILNSYWAVILLSLGLILAQWVRPSFGQSSASRRRILVGLRALVVCLVILLMLRPTHISTQSKSQTATLLLMFDQSRSMQLPSASGTRSRWEAELDTLKQIEPLLQELGRDLEVKIHSYDAGLRAAAWQDDRLVLPEAADGNQTDIGTSLHQAIEQERGKRLVGVILLGDGTQTAFQPEVELYEAARELGNRGYPLYTVAYGPSGDAAQARDVAVENLPEQYSVFVKNELIIRGLIRVRGYVNQAIPVLLTIQDDVGEQQVVGPIHVQADQDNQQLEVSLTYVPQTPGQYRLTLQAEAQPGELVTKNNQLTAFLTVLEGGLRVLYLEGEPRQEQKYIRWALDASPDVDLDFQWFPSRLRKDWPVALGDTLEKGNYDAFILGDCDSQALGDENLQQLADEVERGKGLIAIGGYHSFGPGGYRPTVLGDVLPIEMDRFSRQDFGQPDVEQWHVPGPLVMLPTRSHPVTTLASPAENEQVWRQLRPLQGANRWAGIKEAPGIQVLAESSDRVPLLVAGEYGGGRVLAFAGDSTWQWWRQGQSALHRRFWRQIVLWLARRDDLTRHDVWIDLPQRRFAAGSRVSFTAGARTALGDVIADAVLSATLASPDGQSTPLRLSRQGNDHLGTLERITQPGSYQINVTAQDAAGQPLGEATAHFEVLDQDVEFANPAADPDQMARLADLTRDSGGKAVAPEQLTALLEEIKQHPPELVEDVLTKWQLADTWWDAWLVLSCLVALLTTEWFLRKRWGLV
ncbi:MAG: glutamine amidotransferase [Pirellulaceae bacterium]